MASAPAVTPDPVSVSNDFIRGLGQLTIKNERFSSLEKCHLLSLSADGKNIVINSQFLTNECLKMRQIVIRGFEIIKKEEGKATDKAEGGKAEPKSDQKPLALKYNLTPLFTQAIEKRWTQSVQKLNPDEVIQDALEGAARKITKAFTAHYRELSQGYTIDYKFLKSREYLVPEDMEFLPPHFDHLFESDDPCPRDVKLLVIEADSLSRATTSILAHKIVLLTAEKFYKCDYFRTALASPMKSKEVVKSDSKEKDESESQLDNNTLVFRDTTARAVNQLVRFFYLGEGSVKFESNKEARDLFRLADQLVIANLKALCANSAFELDLEEADPEKIAKKLPAKADSGITDSLKVAFMQANTADALKNALAPTIQQIKGMEGQYKTLLAPHFQAFPGVKEPRDDDEKSDGQKDE